MSAESPREPDWRQLASLARAEVLAAIQSLPPPLREQAERLPVTCEHVPGEDLVSDGIEPDTLGLFVGPAYADEEATPSPIPPQIILFLDNVWDIADGDLEIYREEIRTTFLHELGHYLGLDEDDLYDRGLD